VFVCRAGEFVPLSLRGKEEVFRILRFSNQGAKVHLELWVSVEGEEYSFLRKGARATEDFYLYAGMEEVVRVEGEEFLCELTELSTRRILVGTPELFRRRELALSGMVFARVAGEVPRFSALPATSLTTQLHSISLKWRERIYHVMSVNLGSFTGQSEWTDCSTQEWSLLKDHLAAEDRSSTKVLRTFAFDASFCVHRISDDVRCDAFKARTYIPLFIYISIVKFVCVYMHICKYIHTHTHRYIYTYIYTYIYI
jgi:hypothetical protein